MIHPFEPVCDSECTALVLGTMPSPVSRERGFYYSHPRNRFWALMAELFKQPFPQSIEEKRRLVLDNHIALWDVIASCEIEGASDSKIKNPRCNDFSALIGGSKIRRIYTTGQKAYILYTKFCSSKTGIPAAPLPSTSPANCRAGFAQLLECYAALRDDGRIPPAGA